MRIHSLVVAFGALAFAAQPALSQDAKLLERGTYLMNSIVACGNCHAQFDKQGRPIAELGPGLVSQSLGLRSGRALAA